MYCNGIRLLPGDVDFARIRIVGMIGKPVVVDAYDTESSTYFLERIREHLNTGGFRQLLDLGAWDPKIKAGRNFPYPRSLRNGSGRKKADTVDTAPTYFCRNKQHLSSP